MFIRLHIKETDELFVVNTDYIIRIFETVYDALAVPSASLTIFGCEGHVEVKESVAEIERLMSRDRVYSTLTTKSI